MIFGAGFVSATALIGLAFGIWHLRFCHYFWITLVRSVEIIILDTSQTSNKEDCKKICSVYIGIFLLGFIFYFLDPCIAPIFASMASILFSEVFLLGMLIFCIGAMIPFIGIGLFTSSISKITRKVYRYRHIFRGISGLILLLGGGTRFILFSFLSLTWL